MKFIICIVVMLFLNACSSSSQVEPPLEVSERQNQKIKILPDAENLPPLKEVLTFGYLSEQRAQLEKERQAYYEKKYVGDEKDERNWFEKLLGKATLGVVMGRETKKEYQRRLEKEAEEAARYVSESQDDRGIVAKSLNTLSLGLIADRETIEERNERLAKEAEEAENRDKRGGFLKAIEMGSLGLFTPGKPEPLYSDGAVLKDPQLGQLVYGQSTLKDAVHLLGTPIKKIIEPTGEKEVVFKVEEPSFKYVPYVKKPQVNVRLHFNAKNILVKK
ncbi:MAG TPA: hypothetical protein EYQ86_09350 [Bacteroidetes bacterium]|nr:hypothetical protein [Bacteroidota bacterium]